MNASEFRIGNIVDLYGTNATIQAVDFSTGFGITKGKRIPLNEDWLKKAGYLKKNGYGYSHSNIYGLILKDDIGFEFRYYGISIRLDFVHQLQNLYYSFYDEELIFSNKP